MAEFWWVGGFFCLVREIDFTGMSAFCFPPLDFVVNHSLLLNVVTSAGRNGVK